MAAYLKLAIIFQLGDASWVTLTQLDRKRTCGADRPLLQSMMGNLSADISNNGVTVMCIKPLPNIE